MCKFLDSQMKFQKQESQIDYQKKQSSDYYDSSKETSVTLFTPKTLSLSSSVAPDTDENSPFINSSSTREKLSIEFSSSDDSESVFMK
jgi:hypothetical protein